MVMLVFVRFANVFFRVLIEGFLTTERAKVIGLSFVFGCACGGGGVNIHVADWVMYGNCHRSSPFVEQDYRIVKTALPRAILPGR